MTHSDELSAYTTFGRSDWAALRSNTSLTLSDADLSALRGLNEPISERQGVRQPDILVFEGLNVLHAPGTARAVVSDFFDFSIYLDADEADIQSWYVERFLGLQRTAFRDPASYFHHYTDLPPRDAREVADRLWREHHRANLRENIQPTRTRADVVLRKRSGHSVGEVWLRET